jgi:hypothetical protein
MSPRQSYRMIRIRITKHLALGPQQSESGSGLKARLKEESRLSPRSYRKQEHDRPNLVRRRHRELGRMKGNRERQDRRKSIENVERAGVRFVSTRVRPTCLDLVRKHLRNNRSTRNGGGRSQDCRRERSLPHLPKIERILRPTPLAVR